MDKGLRHHISVDELDDNIKATIKDIGISEEQYVNMMNKVVDIVIAGEEENSDEED